jgi:hypothetical protein
MRTVYVRYKNPFSTTDAGDIAVYLTDLLRSNPTAHFYLIVAPNRTFAVGALKDEKYERWQVKELRYIRDENFRPYFLYFAPFNFWAGEWSAILYGGILGKVRRERPAVPLNFYLLETDLELKDSEKEAGATKEAVWEIFKVDAEAGRATVRPLLCDGEPLLVVKTDAPFLTTVNILADFIEGVLTK